MKEMKIYNRLIGPAHPPLVIAEIGINHEGDMNKARMMVDAAVNAGCECVKFQSHVVEDEMSAEAKKVIPGNADVSIYEIMARCALTEEQEGELKAYVESKGAIFLSTPFSRAAANRLHRLGVKAFKIGSGECNNYPLIRHIASMGKPVILSTGMNSIESVKKSVKILREAKVPFALLHTTSLYPTPYEKVRLGAMQELEKEFPDAVIGLSDHTLSNNPCLGAVALGASILERHFTVDKSWPGPDVPLSMDPEECTLLIEGSKQIWQASGGTKEILEDEQVTIDFAYATVVTIAPIKKGEKLTAENLWVKRPGTGKILAEHFDSLIGATALHDIPSDTHIDWSDIDGVEK